MKSITKRTSTSVAAIAALGLLASACDIETAATQLEVVIAQEDGFFSDGDEPYVGVLQWRVTPGSTGSASATVLAPITAELSPGAFDGTVLPIPASAGTVEFTNVVPVATQQLATGSLPEVMGTVLVVMESDAVPFTLFDNAMLDAAAQLEDELEAHIETMTFPDLTNPLAVSAAVAGEMADVLDEVEPDVTAALDIWFSGVFDPDDFIGVGFTVYVSSAGPLSNFFNTLLPITLPSNAIGGAWSNNLDPKLGDISFTGDGASYIVDIVATPSL